MRYDIEQIESPYGLAIPTTGLFQDDELIVQVERYQDQDPEGNPVAWANFRKRLSRLHTEYDIWQTVIVDSMTFAEISARYESQFKLNSSAKDMRRHFAYSTDEIERAVMIRMGCLPCNSAVLCHIDEAIVQDDEHKGGQSVAIRDEVNGVLVRNPAAPGRLRKRLPGGYTALFRSYVQADGQGNRTYLWQTQADNKWNAGNQLDSDNPCEATYESLWTNWKGPRIPIRVVVYGDPMSGKSTAFATFPKPILVFSFDPNGKELPYLQPKDSWYVAA